MVNSVIWTLEGEKVLDKRKSQVLFVHSVYLNYFILQTDMPKHQTIQFVIYYMYNIGINEV